MPRIQLYRIITALLTCALCATNSADGQALQRDIEPSPRLKILGFSGPPAFVPEALLTSVPVEELGLSDNDLLILRGMKTHSQPPGCQRDLGTARPGQFSSLTINQAVATEKVVIIGTVERIVPGWDAWRKFVGNAIYLGVEEIFRGNPKNLQVVAVSLPGATITLEGVPIGTNAIEGTPQPLIGDRLLIAGMPSEVGPPFVQEVLVLPIVNGEVHPVPSPILAPDARPIAVDRLRHLLREK